MKEDPVVTQAKRLWQERQPREAMQLLVRRIGELSEHAPAQPRRSRHLVFGFIAGFVVCAIVAGILAFASGNLSAEKSEQSDRQVSDCGAREWWNYNAGLAMDVVDSMKSELSFDFQNYNSYSGTVLDYYEDSQDENISRIEVGDYPVCVREARQQLLAGFGEYGFYFSEMRYLASTEYMRSEYQMEIETTYQPDLEETLTDAESYMAAAAKMIADLTGADTSFLIIDHPEAWATPSLQ